jgi:integral membrane sensor domain MASE1
METALIILTLTLIVGGLLGSLIGAVCLLWTEKEVFMKIAITSLLSCPVGLLMAFIVVEIYK